MDGQDQVVLPEPEEPRSPEPQPGERDDDDSGIEDTADSSTASITPSVLEYQREGNRQYHSGRFDIVYWAPNDESQLESMDMNHELINQALRGKLFLAPLPPKLQRALDIGTGTGIWAINFADAHEECEVTGIDISPVQPDFVPPNLQFFVDDCNDEWAEQDASLDYVHIQYMLGSVKDWARLFRQAFRCCRPGGFVESCESKPFITSDDGSVTAESSMGRWGGLFSELAKQTDLAFDIAMDDRQEHLIRAAGFTQVTKKEIKVPIGEWPEDPRQRKLGRIAQETLCQDLPGYVQRAAMRSGWSRAVIELFCCCMRKEMENRNIHGYFILKVVWGRKPCVNDGRD